MSAWFGRVTALIGAAVISLAIGGCYQDIEKASFSRWKVDTAGKPKIIFYDIGALSGEEFGDIFAYVDDIHAKALSSLSPGTAVVSGNFRRLDLGPCSSHFYRPACEFRKDTKLFVSSQKEVDAWNRYFAELVANREKGMRELWAPKKIQPPPTLQKSD